MQMLNWFFEYDNLDTYDRVNLDVPKAYEKYQELSSDPYRLESMWDDGEGAEAFVLSMSEVTLTLGRSTYIDAYNASEEVFVAVYIAIGIVLALLVPVLEKGVLRWTMPTISGLWRGALVQGLCTVSVRWAWDLVFPMSKRIKRYFTAEPLRCFLPR